MRALAGVLTLVCLGGLAQTPPPPPPEPRAADLHEVVLTLPVTLKDLYGREATRSIQVTTFRPDGSGPFPLVIMNHGRAHADKRAQPARQRFERLARYLVSKGFAVFVPTRVGYGDSYGDFDPEDTGRCASPRLQPAAQAASDQVLATLALARAQPWVDASRWVVMGQSVGGFTTMAVVARHPPGLVAAINFAGGIGGNPETRAGDPCGPTMLSDLYAHQAAGTELTMLWLYWLNDRYWGADWPRQWAQAWTGGGGKLEFHQLAPAGRDGHGGLNFDMDHWVPLVEAYLAQAGFATPGRVARPSAGRAVRPDAFH